MSPRLPLRLALVGLLLAIPAVAAAAPAPIRSGPPAWNYFLVGVLTSPELDHPAFAAGVGAEIVLKDPISLSGELAALSTLRKGDTGAALASVNLGLHHWTGRLGTFLNAGPTVIAAPFGATVGYNVCAALQIRRDRGNPGRVEYRVLRFEGTTAHRLGVGLVF